MTRIAQIAAVLSSALLAGGFICYQAGALQFLTAAKQSHLPETPGEGDTEGMLMYGSKAPRFAPASGAGPSMIAPEGAKPPSKDEILMLGSKSAPVFTPPSKPRTQDAGRTAPGNEPPAPPK